MKILIIFTVFFVLYSAIVRATYLKFKNNGIGFNVKYKFLVILLPALIFFLHLKLAIRFFKHDKKKSLFVLKIAIVKYPVILGNLIEVILESMAECNVYGSSKYLSVRKKKQRQLGKNPLDSVSLKMKELVDFLKKDSNYEKELLSGISY